jgi:RNA polymerase sigma-70 factor (ECF subfamily)
MGVVRGIEQFEGRSSLRTWLFRILVNRARSAGSSERRSGGGSVPVSVDGGAADMTDDGPAVDPSFFDTRGSWVEPVVRWGEDNEDRLDAATMAPFLKVALDKLPPRQRQVVVLRDLEGLSGSEVCDVLGVSPGNQRLLLHRGRNQLRRDLGTVVRRG